MEKGNCPNASNHTDSPILYNQWHAWAAKMAKTHRQTRCPDCGLYVIWVPKKPKSGAAKRQEGVMRYVLHPCYVTSRNDGQQHFIDGPSLARLYRVNMKDCVYGNDMSYREQPGDVHLYPRWDGNYQVPQ